MAFSIRLPENDRVLLAIIAIIYLATRLPAMLYLPFVQDESLFTMMIEEQMAHPTIVPTLFGYPIIWKPILLFWTYGVLTRPLLHLLPLEAAYRLPSLLFGLAALAPAYLLLRNSGASKPLAFFTAIIFLFSFLSVYPQVAVLTDSLLFFLIMSSLYLYSEQKYGDWRFMAAGAIAFAAFFVKALVAFMIPVLAVAYFLSRRMPPTRLFVLSLLAVPLAFLAHAIIMNDAGLGGQAYSDVIAGPAKSGVGIAGYILGSSEMLMESAGIWFALSLFGFLRHWKDDLFMALWYCLTIFPLIAGFYMPWYYLPVLPAMSYFAVALLLKWDGKEKADALFVSFIIMALAASVFMACLLYSGLHGDFIAQKEAGLIVAGKENVLFLGGYAPGAVSYKALSEISHDGRALDFGWIIIDQNDSATAAMEFIRDYHSGKYAVTDGSFSDIFTKRGIYRKDTALASFDYIVWQGKDALPVENASVLYNRSNITIYALARPA